MQDFLQDKLINKLNGYYLLLYANDKRIKAACVACINHTFVYMLVFLKLIPPRIKHRKI